MLLYHVKLWNYKCRSGRAIAISTLANMLTCITLGFPINNSHFQGSFFSYCVFFVGTGCLFNIQHAVHLLIAASMHPRFCKSPWKQSYNIPFYPPCSSK